MAYPRKLLTEGEEIVFDLHPHWKVLVVPGLLAPIIVFMGSFGIARAPDGSAHSTVVWALFLAMVVLLVIFCLAPLLTWLTTHFVVTNRRVIMREGVLSRTGRDVPLYRINDVTFTHSLLERMLGAGTLIVESAGERGQVTLGDIPHVEHVQREIYRLMEDDDERRRRTPDDEEPPPAVGP